MSPKARPESILGGLAEQTKAALATLTPREEKILRERFGIAEPTEGGEGSTLEEVGQDFEVTRQRIREIEAKALAKLRAPGRSKRLQEFIAGGEAESEGDGEGEEEEEAE